MEYTKRTIHYYELELSPFPAKTVDILIYEIFRHIIELNTHKARERFIKGPGYLSCTREVLFRTNENIIQGKLLRIRMDSFPELIDVAEDIVKDIVKGEDDGVVESTHFMIKYTKKAVTIAMEFNQFGAKINELKWYVDFYLRRLELDCVLLYKSIVQDDIETFFRRINRCSSLMMKVHKDNVKRVQQVSPELFSAANAALEVGESEYVELFIKFDYQKRTDTPEITGKVKTWLNFFNRNKELSKSIFDDFTVKAEDTDKNYRLEYFDFISDKVKSYVNVQLRPQSRSIVSLDMFEKIEKEFNAKDL